MLAPRLDVRDLKVRSLDIDRKEVSWTIGPEHDALNFRCVVQRSESPEGPWEDVSPSFEDHYLFVDSRVPAGDKYRQLWYQVVTTHKASGDVQVYGPATHEAEPDLIAMTMRRHGLTLLSAATGRQVWVFKRRTFGPRCSACWDPVTHTTIRAGCMDCFGTSFMRGYHNPIEVWMQIDPPNEKQAGEVGARAGWYPGLNPKDIVVEAENKRHIVTRVSPVERLRALIRQELVLAPIDDTDVLYRLPVNLETALRDIQPSPGRMFTLPHDINSAIDEQTPHIFANYVTRPRNP